MLHAIKTFKISEKLSLWIGAAAALGLGLTSVGVAFWLHSFLAPNANPAAAAWQGILATSNGQASAMRSVFRHEIELDHALGIYIWPQGGTAFRVLFAEKGQAISFSAFPKSPKNSKWACTIEMGIDGDGAPSMERAAFASFSGSLTGSSPSLTGARALAAAFTTAHELAHCSLATRPWGYASASVARELELGGKASPSDLDALKAFMDTTFGMSTYHEGYADSLAAIAIAHRTPRPAFRQAMSLIAARRAMATPEARFVHSDAAHKTQYALAAAAVHGWTFLSAVRNQGAADKIASESAASGTISAIARGWGDPAVSALPASLRALARAAESSRCHHERIETDSDMLGPLPACDPESVQPTSAPAAAPASSIP